MLVNRTADTVISLLPANVITEEEFDAGIDLLEAAIVAVTEDVRR